MFFGAVVVGISLYLQKDVLYCATVIAIVVISYFLSKNMHQGYIDMIIRLQEESDTDELTSLLNRRAGSAQMR